MVDFRRLGVLVPLGQFMSDCAFEARRRRDEAVREGRSREFEDGEIQGYHEIISLMQDLARKWDIPLEELSIDVIDPERDLI